MLPQSSRIAAVILEYDVGSSCRVSESASFASRGAGLPLRMHPRMVASIAVDAHSVCAHICAAAQETVVNGTALGWSVELRYTNYRARLLLIRLADIARM